MSKRVLLAGIFHETHTFLPSVTRLADFSIRRGDELLTARGDGSPLAGVLEVADEAGWQIVPAIDLRATPSGTVEDRVLEEFWTGLQATALPALEQGLDGVYLVLHGAMVCRSYLDAEGEALARLRQLPGMADLPVCGVTDLHGNFSQQMADGADGLVAYRENPHTDAHAAAVDGARLLDRLMRTGKRAKTVWERPPLMWPPTGVGTADEPMRGLEALARQIEREQEDLLAVNVYAGYSFADTPDTGVSFTAVTVGDEDTARRQLRRLSDYAMEHRALGNRTDPPLGVEHLVKPAGAPAGPIVLVEPSDNIGGGAPGDGTAMLRFFVQNNVDGAGVIINDPASVASLSTIKAGESLTLDIGGRENVASGGPLRLAVTLVSTSDGRFEIEDRHSHLASMCGVNIDMGPCAVVRHAGITLLLTSRQTPPFDLGQWRSQGVDPAAFKVVAVKAAVAHRRAYDRITGATYTVDTPGPCSSNLRAFTFRHLRRPVYPLDEV